MKDEMIEAAFRNTIIVLRALEVLMAKYAPDEDGIVRTIRDHISWSEDVVDPPIRRAS